MNALVEVVADDIARTQDRLGQARLEVQQLRQALVKQVSDGIVYLTQAQRLRHALYEILALHEHNKDCVVSLDDCCYTKAEQIAADALKGAK